MTLTDSVKAARRAGTPLLCIRTADPAATITRINNSLNGTAATTPIIQWDVIRGPIAGNEHSGEILSKSLADANLKPEQVKGPAPFLQFTRKLPPQSIVFMMNLHRFCEQEIGVIQSLWNLRDEFKGAGKCIIGLCPQITLPAELSQDMLVLDEPLPTDAELKAIAVDIYTAGQLEQPTEAELDKIADATLGLAAFPAEQSMAMSLKKTGMDMMELWSKKRSVISQTDGLSVVKPSITLDDIGGVGNAKGFIRRVINGAEPPRCFVFIDEGEKAFSGSSVGGGDTSGVSQNFLGTLLTEMQEQNYSGAIFIGFPGSAKSMLAKAAGTTAGVPTIQFDLAGMKNSLVGASEANLRRALATVKAVSQGRAYFLMTCNSIGSLPPELKRRFRDIVLFFDVPDRAEKDAIWSLYIKQYAERLKGLDLTIPPDEHWTGAEISVCINNAYKWQCSLRESAGFIVPAFQSMGIEKANQLRQEASGRYISATYSGPYQAKRVQSEPAQSTGKRNIKLES